MTDQRIEGAVTRAEGAVRRGLGDLAGDARLQLEGRLKDAQGRALGAWGRAIDGLGGLVEKAPAQYQDRARQGLDFARRKPLLTTGVLAGAVLLLGGLGSGLIWPSSRRLRR